LTSRFGEAQDATLQTYHLQNAEEIKHIQVAAGEDVFRRTQERPVYLTKICSQR